MRVVDEIERLNEQVYKLEEKYCNNCQEFVCHFCHEMDERCEARTMKRLIYLEDAIDALEHKKDKNAKGDIGGFYNKIIQNDIDALKQLPSVQPQRWIPVTEALPNDGVEVWVTIKGHDVIRREEGETLEQAIDRINKIRWVTRGYWSDEEHAWNDPSFAFPLMVQPIAWMPMDTPEPYKEGQNDT